MSQLWTIADLTTGTVLSACFVTPSTGSHPKDNGWAWDAARQKATRIGAVPDPSTQSWSGTAWVDDPARVEAKLIAEVKEEAERRKMAMLSSGGAKKTEYADKYREVAAWDSLGGTVTAILLAFNALSANARALRFPYAVASAAAFGDTPNDAITRFKGGITRAGSVPTLAAIEERACAAIKAATTAAAKRAVFIAIPWPA